MPPLSGQPWPVLGRAQAEWAETQDCSARSRGPGALGPAGPASRAG